jgi:hypothetical protein
VIEADQLLTVSERIRSIRKEKITLETGDAIYFAGSLPHLPKNVSKRDVEFLVVDLLSGPLEGWSWQKEEGSGFGGKVDLGFIKPAPH